MSREPSMEDILSSIRKVIARDDAPGLNIGRADEADVLELDTESPDGEGAAAEPAPVVVNEELVGSDTANAARASLDALSAAVQPPESAAAPLPNIPSGSRTIDDVVIEAIRPMLKTWLDTNLPPLVEAMVAKEIARITGRRF
jgi:cell pole-organizing protein PopZ